ncbi:hypothetical protein Plhal304r1_c052g0136591 [Plasmopara halstedii]
MDSTLHMQKRKYNLLATLVNQHCRQYHIHLVETKVEVSSLLSDERLNRNLQQYWGDFVPWRWWHLHLDNRGRCSRERQGNTITMCSMIVGSDVREVVIFVKTCSTTHKP